MLFASFLSDTSSGDSFSLKGRHYFLFLSLPPHPTHTHHTASAPWVFPPPALQMELNTELSPAPSCKGWGVSRGQGRGARQRREA